MSYSTLDRHGGIVTKYAHAKARNAPAGGQGLRTWWPDFGPGCQDFSQQRRSHPSEMVFERVIAPTHKWSATAGPPRPCTVEPLAPPMRDPEPARRAMLHEAEPGIERRLAAHSVTERQAALSRLESRQRRVDAWAGETPVKMTHAYISGGLAQGAFHQALQGGRTASAPSLGARAGRAATAPAAVPPGAPSREDFARSGYLVGRSQGSIADGLGGGGEARRRHDPLSMKAMLHKRMGTPASGARTLAPPRKRTSPWRVSPEASIAFDPRNFLPVPRGGWAAHELTAAEWPDALPAGSRDFAAADHTAPPAGLACPGSSA